MKKFNYLPATSNLIHELIYDLSIDREYEISGQVQIEQEKKLFGFKELNPGSREFALGRTFDSTKSFCSTYGLPFQQKDTSSYGSERKVNRACRRTETVTRTISFSIPAVRAESLLHQLCAAINGGIVVKPSGALHDKLKESEPVKELIERMYNHCAQYLLKAKDDQSIAFSEIVMGISHEGCKISIAGDSCYISFKEMGYANLTNEQFGVAQSTIILGFIDRLKEEPYIVDVLIERFMNGGFTLHALYKGRKYQDNEEDKIQLKAWI